VKYIDKIITYGFAIEYWEFIFFYINNVNLFN